jgi:hypothetical protein
LPDFTLPSGRVVQLKDEPTWGDMCDADEVAVAAEREGRNWPNARATHLMSAMTGMDANDIRAMGNRDVSALAAECKRRALPKDEPSEQEFRDAVATFFLMGSLDDPPRELVEFVLADRFKWSPGDIAALPVSAVRRYQHILSAEARIARTKAE